MSFLTSQEGVLLPDSAAVAVPSLPIDPGSRRLAAKVLQQALLDAAAANLPRAS